MTRLLRLFARRRARARRLREAVLRAEGWVDSGQYANREGRG